MGWPITKVHDFVCRECNHSNATVGTAAAVAPVRDGLVVVEDGIVIVIGYSCASGVLLGVR
jgi:hypothetical protein